MIYYVVCSCGKCIVCSPPVKASEMVACRHCGASRLAAGGQYLTQKEESQKQVDLLEVL